MITCLALSPSLDVTYLLPALVPGEIHRPRTVLRHAGGKALNVARAASVLGGDARAIAALGGRVGQLVGDLLGASGVAFSAVECDDETRSCLTVAADDADGLTEFYEPAGALSDETLRRVADLVARVPAGERIVLAGSVPPLDLDLLVDLLRGRRLVVDTHGVALAAFLDGASPELVKVNRSEAAALAALPGDAPLESLADALRQRSGGTVVITDGTAGSLALDEHGAYRVSPDPVHGRYPVGSGDSFLAGLLVGLERGDALPDALLLAAASGSANAQGPGAAVFTAAQVEESRARLVLP
ncbi:1-phosphofructokinase family hexose kinase [soil metagenome]